MLSHVTDYNQNYRYNNQKILLQNITLSITTILEQQKVIKDVEAKTRIA